MRVKKIARFLKKKFLNDELSLQVKLFNIASLVGIIGGIVSGITSFFIGAPLLQNIGVAVVILTFSVSFYFANWRNHFKEASLTIICVISLVLFPILFFLGGGVDGGMVFWLALGIIFNFIIIGGRESYILVVTQILVAGGCFTISYFHPDYVQPCGSTLTRFLDIFQSFVLFTLIIGVIFKMQNEYYSKRCEKLLKINRELAKQKKIAEEATLAKHDFLSAMTQEIKQPVNDALEHNEKILSESSNSQIISHASKIKSSYSYLLSLIDNVLDISDIEAKKSTVLEEDYSLGEFLADIRNFSKAICGGRGIDFEMEWDRNLPSVLRGDMDKLRQTVLNIISHVSTNSEKGRIDFLLGGTVTGNRVILDIDIKVSGYRVAGDGSNYFSEFNGCGMELLIAKKICDMLDARISVNSSFKDGSDFKIEIEQPVTEMIPVGKNVFKDGEKSLSSENILNVKDVRLLAVDDMEMSLVIFQNMLKDTAITVDIADNGKDALKLAEKNRYDLIFLDHIMPEMDGIETFHRLRDKDCPNTDTPVVMLTANSFSGVRESYLNEGFCDYLAKPLDFLMLKSVLLRHLPEEKIL